MKSKERISLLQISQFLAVALSLVWPAAAQAQTVVATIPLDAKPYAVAVNPITDKSYVANCRPGFLLHLSQGSVTVIDGRTNTTTTIPFMPGTCPSDVAVNTVTNKIYVADLSGIIVIVGATNSTSTLPGEGNTVAVNPVTNKIYAAGPNGNVTVIDGATNSTMMVTDPHANGLSPSGIAINPTTNKIYVANNSIGTSDTNPGNVTVIDGATNSTTTITDPNAIFPVSVAVNSTTNRIYVANMGAGTNHGNVTVIDGATNSITTVTDSNALSPGGPGGLDVPGFGIAVNSATNKIYVANWGSNNVTVIDGATNATTTVTDPNAVGPIAVAVDSVTNMFYVANAGNPGSVTAINGATNAVTTVIDPNALGGSIALAVDPATDKIYVANSGSNATVIDGAAAPTSHILSFLLIGSGSGTVTSNPPGINCEKSCTASFAAGTAVSLTAAAAMGSIFSGWSTNCSGTGACNLNMTSDEFVKATFNLVDFSITPASASLIAQRGGQVTDVITIAPLNGSFSNAVQLSCAVTGPLPVPACSLSPTSVTPGANSASSTLTVTAPTGTAMLAPSIERQSNRSLFAMLLPLTLFGITLLAGSKKERRHSWILCCFLLLLAGLQMACGGGSSSVQHSSQNYTVTVTGASPTIASPTIQHSTQVVVTVP